MTRLERAVNQSLRTWKRVRMSFSLSPRHLLGERVVVDRRGEAHLASEEQRTLKKVVWNLEATAWG